MPTLKSASKRLRQNIKRKAANRQKVAKMRTEIKKTIGSIADGKVEDAKKQFVTAAKSIDKTAKKNIIHPNKAARQKSRLAKKLNAANKK